MHPACRAGTGQAGRQPCPAHRTRPPAAPQTPAASGPDNDGHDQMHACLCHPPWEPPHSALLLPRGAGAPWCSVLCTSHPNVGNLTGLCELRMSPRSSRPSWLAYLRKKPTMGADGCALQARRGTLATTLDFQRWSEATTKHTCMLQCNPSSELPTHMVRKALVIVANSCTSRRVWQSPAVNPHVQSPVTRCRCRCSRLGTKPAAFQLPHSPPPPRASGPCGTARGTPRRTPS